jgi:hypothetical protein
MAGYEHEYDRDKHEQGGRVALDIALENCGYKEDRLAEVRRRASYAAKLRALGR